MNDHNMIPADSMLATDAALYSALAKAQGQMTNPVKNREVSVKSDRGAYKFAYATLDSILDGIRKPLADNGLAMTQALEQRENGLAMVMRIFHAGGGQLTTIMPLDHARAVKMQELGSLMTFARRYQVAAFFGLAAEEDDDANSADGNQRELRDRRPSAPPAAPAAPKAFDARSEFRRLRDAIKAQPDAISIAQLLMQEATALRMVKDASEDGYASLMKEKDNRLAELQAEDEV